MTAVNILSLQIAPRDSIQHNTRRRTSQSVNRLSEFRRTADSSLNHISFLQNYRSEIEKCTSSDKAKALRHANQ